MWRTIACHRQFADNEKKVRMMVLPSVLCVCPTYGRYPNRTYLLEEAIESFLRQDYIGRKTMVVVNDCPSQQLICEGTKNVYVMSLSKRLDTLGEKYNRGINFFTTHMGKSDLIMPWEDDDISLPHRISASVDRITGRGTDRFRDGAIVYDYYNPRAYWFLNGSHFAHEQMTGYAHNASVFTCAAWEKVGGYPHNCWQDAGMDSKLRSVCSTQEGPLTAEESWYIYRFGVSDHHVSAYRNPEEAYIAYGRRPVVSGTFEIKPHWRQDYVAMTKAVLNASTSSHK